MSDILLFPGNRQGPADPLRGIDGRALLDVVAVALAAVYCPYRYDAPRDALLSARSLAAMPLEDPERDSERRFLARALAAMLPEHVAGLLRQAGQIEAGRNRQRRAERTRRRAAA